MRSYLICAAMLSALSLSSAALAQAPAIRTGQMVKTSDGKRIGHVYEVLKAKDGTITGIRIIKDSRLIKFDAATLTASETGLTTSLTNDEVKKLK